MAGPNTVAQCDDILAHLQSGRPITQLDALRMYGVGRLAARIHELRKKGHPIQSRSATVTKSSGEKARVSEYYL